VTLALIAAIAARVDHRIPLALGLGSLVGMATMLALGNGKLSDLLATIGYFSLAFATFLALAHTLRSTTRGPNSTIPYSDGKDRE
jgi:hypothetical protein